MPKNNSFRNFSNFSKNTPKTDERPSMQELAQELNDLHVIYQSKIAKYDEWASKTILAESISPIHNPLGAIKFADMFKVSKTTEGYNVVVFNPLGVEGGTNWNKNESSFVNAFLQGFGTQRYTAEITHGLHDRLFDESKVQEHNVRSMFVKELNRWVRQDWKNGRFVDNTPYTGRNAYTNEGSSWLAKHVELDMLLMAVAGRQSIKYIFFPNRETGVSIAWERFTRNVLDNMKTTIADINIQLANQAEVSSAMRKVEQAQKLDPSNVQTVMIDSVDLGSLSGIVKFAIKMNGESEQTRILDMSKQNDVKLITAISHSKKLEAIKIVK